MTLAQLQTALAATRHACDYQDGAVIKLMRALSDAQRESTRLNEAHVKARAALRAELARLSSRPPVIGVKPGEVGTTQPEPTSVVCGAVTVQLDAGRDKERVR